MEFRDLKAQYQALKPEIDASVEQVMTGTSFIMGEPVEELEARLAEYVGVKHCITCANGTDALTLAEMSCDIKSGDAVFVPDFTFFASAETIAVLGATPIFVDVEETTYNMDAAKLEEAIRLVLEKGKLRPRAIVAVDLFGQCANFTKISELAKTYGLLVIEDGAQGFGGKIGDRRACSFGDVSTTSFFPAKPLGCYGDGGAVFTSDDEKAELIRSLRVHGKGTNKYDNVRLGMNSRLDTIQAAILLVKFKAFTEYELDAVNKAASLYTQCLEGQTGLPIVPSQFYSSWAQYTIRLFGEEERKCVQTSLKAAGIPAMIYYPKAMHQQAAFSTLPPYNCCPTSERLCQRVLSLPMHPYMSEGDIRFVCERLDAALHTLN